MRLAFYPEAESEIQPRLLEKVESNQAKMRDWASHAPMNFQSKYELVEAEKARIRGEIAVAIAHYDSAIELARESGYLQEMAIAAERAADLCQAWGRERFAQLYLVDAHYAYFRWGAGMKVEQLQQKYPQLLSPIKLQGQAIPGTTVTASTATDTLTGVLDLSTVMKASQAISGEIVLDKLLSKLMQLAIENAGAQRGFLILATESKLKIEASGEVNGSQINVSESQDVDNEKVLPVSLIQFVQRTLEDVVLANATSEGRFTTDPYIVRNKPKSILAAPILNQGKFIGILYLENNLATKAFTADRLELLKIISSQAAISLENALLYRTLEDKVTERTAQLAQANAKILALNERLKEENLRMSAELEVAKQLQQMVLPKSEELSAIAELEIAGFMEPADEVGGDYYDVLPHDNGVKIAIGDVTGHGLESGVLMIMAQTAVRTLQESGETDPVKFFDILNRTLYANLQRLNPFKNLTLAVVDYVDGQLFLSGQHEELIVVRADGTIEKIDTINLGFPLGLELNIADFIDQKRVQLTTGDIVVLYTDGITEAEDINQQLYGLQKLCEVIKINRHQSAELIREAVIKDVRRHIGTQKMFDDLTLVVLKSK
ncbi:MAG: GAF domain-containing SpoIIE family protein phosphatase [Oscillatoria sp. PMC 1068.18]|nr:GAF domain-containing SpoIIE family protein phosphatase [Oscillatoria sp. PMC 1076.18]MEC4988901.1 GAF domain-containing SpoIIE family protein phosphatase [Oscillatoria sp. PMC 1068.18]